MCQSFKIFTVYTMQLVSNQILQKLTNGTSFVLLTGALLSKGYYLHKQLDTNTEYMVHIDISYRKIDNILCYVTLRYVTLRYVTLRYVTLRYVMLRNVMLCYTWYTSISVKGK